MRRYVENILTPAEAETLVGFNGKVPFDIGAVPNVVGEMERLGAAVTPKSYCRIEGKSDGHDWHVDTGDSNHMPWCAWSASVLLTPPDLFEGGAFQFAGPSEEHRGHYCDAIIFTSDEQHRVLPHQGSRKVLLVFLGADNGE